MPVEILPKDHKRCNECHKLFHKDYFYITTVKSRKYIKPNCKQCEITYCKNNRHKSVISIVKYKLNKSKYDADNLGYVSCSASLPELIKRYTEICDSCGEYGGKSLCLDHCHKTGKFRGFICKPCNRAIGCAKDDAKRLMGCSKYLERS